MSIFTCFSNFTIVVHPGIKFRIVLWCPGDTKNILKHRNHGYEKRGEKDKQIACREEEVGECPDCSFEDEIFQVFFFLRWSEMVLTQCDCRAVL